MIRLWPLGCIAALSVRAYRKKTLTPLGVATAIVVSSLYSIHPWGVFLVMLLSFYITSTFFTKVSWIPHLYPISSNISTTALPKPLSLVLLPPAILSFSSLITVIHSASGSYYILIIVQTRHQRQINNQIRRRTKIRSKTRYKNPRPSPRQFPRGDNPHSPTLALYARKLLFLRYPRTEKKSHVFPQRSSCIWNYRVPPSP